MLGVRKRHDDNTDTLFPVLSAPYYHLASVWHGSHNYRVNIGTWLLLKAVFFWDFLSFIQSLSFCSRSHPGHHITLTCHASVVSSWMWQRFRFFLFLVALAVLSRPGQVYCRVSLNWDLFFVFLKLRLWILGKTTTEVKCPSHHIVSSVHTIHRVLSVEVDWSPGWGCIRQPCPL